MPLFIHPATTGGWVAFAAESRLLAVGGPTTEEFVRSAWLAINSDGAFQAALDLLTSGGLAATPSFVLLEWDLGFDTLRAIVRGEALVSVADASGSNEVSAVGVSTWVERSLVGVTQVAVTVPDAQSAAVPSSLPLVVGVALISGFTISASDEKPSAIAPVTAVTPTAPPETSRSKPAPVTAPTPKIAKAAKVAAKPAIEIDIEATRTDAPIEAEQSSPEQSYDYLFGETMHRQVSDAAVRESDETETEAVTEVAGDHDGHTVLTSDIAKLRSGRKSKTPTAAPVVGQSITLNLSTGSREPLTQPVLIGRSPSVSKVSGGQMPRLVTVGHGDQDISRNHAQFVLEGDTVVVTDLHSRNGTTVALPGKDPQKLRAGEPTSILVGTVVDLGGGLTITVEDDATVAGH